MHMKKVVFICRGNLIRSQIFKAIYNKITDGTSFAEGYGTDVVADGNEGKKLIDHKYLAGLIKTMNDHGFDISQEVSKQLTEDEIKDSYEIIIMGRRKNIPEWMNKYNYEYWEDCINGIEKNKDLNLNLKIPSFGDAQDIEETINFLENKVKNLIKLP